MIEPELLEILNSFKDEFKNIGNKFQSLENEIKSMKNEIKSLENKFEGLENKFEGLENKFQGLENEFKIMKNDLKETRNEVQNLKIDMNKKFAVVNERIDIIQSSCARIEYEYGKKLDTFFDYIKEDMDKHEQYENNLITIDSKLTDHAIRLAILESSEVYESILEKKRKQKQESTN